MSNYNLEQDVFRLLREEPFFAAISRIVNKIPAAHVRTAGVRVTEDGNFEMYYNPDWMESLPDIQRRGIIKHEMYHLLFEHCTGRIVEPGKPITRMQNAAADMAINCHLKGEVPAEGWFPEKMGFEDYLSYEQYLALIEAKVSKEKNGSLSTCKGEGDPDSDMQLPGGGEDIDDHEGWGENPASGDGDRDGDTNRAIAKERLREAAKKGVEDASRSSKGFGNMHESVKKMIMRFINGSVDWRAVLRNFIGQTQRANRSNTVKRINRRFPYVHPGRKTNHTAHIAVAIDQSGSVDDELLGLFFAELNSLAKRATFTVVPFDTRVVDNKVYVWKKGQKHQTERVLNGGTCFNAPTEWVNNHPEIDGLIVLTDMQAPEPVPCKRRRLWLTDEAGKEAPYFKSNELVIPIKRKPNG